MREVFAVFIRLLGFRVSVAQLFFELLRRCDFQVVCKSIYIDKMRSLGLVGT